jgi:hypothetical protein
VKLLASQETCAVTQTVGIHADATNEPKRFKLFLDKQRYLEVDDNGYVSGVAEGNVGCILTLHDIDTPGTIYALKIPRLRGETLTESANICQITKAELKNVQKAHEYSGGSGLVGLVPQYELLQKQCLTLNADDDKAPGAKELHGSVLFIQFDSNRLEPRIVAINDQSLSNDEKAAAKDAPLRFFPASIGESEKTLLRLKWQELKSNGDIADFATAGFILAGAKGDRISALEQEAYFVRTQLATAHETENTNSAVSQRSVWYFGLPSIVYDWADGTLQAAIGEGLLSDWLMADYCTLLKQIATGIETLHQRGLLHCDLRPANIMWREDGRSADKYLVNDYGSFSVDQARTPSDSKSAKNTLLGAGIPNSGRVSPFYAKERRQAIQRESAEVAVVVYEDKTSTWLLLLGWRADIFGVKDANGIPTSLLKMSDKGKAIRDRIVRDAPSETSEQSEDGLSKNDRIRVRDVIFDVISTRDLGAKGMIVRCSDRPSVVLHDKVVIRCESGNAKNGPIKDGLVFSIPSYSEFYQWTAATDLFSLGALALYCPFMNCKLFPSTPKDGEVAYMHADSPSLDVTAAGESANTSDESGAAASLRRAEAEFDEFFQLVTNQEYFQIVWDGLSCFRHMLKEVQKKAEQGGGMDMGDVAEVTVPHKDNIKLTEFALNLVNDIVQVVPHIRDFLNAFPPLKRSHGTRRENVNSQVNTADFLLFMYFAMGCLHRKSNFNRGGSDEAVYRKADPAPFCKDRFEQSTVIDFLKIRKDPEYADQVPEFNAISRASKCLDEDVVFFLEQTWMAAFDTDLSQIPARSGESTYQTVLDKKRLHDQLVGVKSAARELAEARRKLGVFERPLIQLPGQANVELQLVKLLQMLSGEIGERSDLSRMPQSLSADPSTEKPDSQ